MLVRPRVLIPALSALILALAVGLALGPLDAMPHVSDEVVYSMQARLFASGLRVGPPADIPELLSYPFWQVRPASFSVFPPGWPALLAVGERLGVPWLVNPMLAACLPPLTWLFAREWTDAPRAALAAAVVALSPAVLVLAASRMAHTSVLVALLGLALVVQRARDPLWAWALGGLGAAYVVLARPFDAVLVGGPLLLAGLWRAPDHARRAPLLALPGLAAAYTLYDNHQLTGDALLFPVNVWFDAWLDGKRPGCNALGFGPEHGCAPTFGSMGHSPVKALRTALDSGIALDRLLLGIPGGSVLLALGLASLRPRRALLLLPALVIGGYALYWSPGRAYGPRFWHPLFLLLPLWTAEGAYRLLGRAAWLPLLAVPFGLRSVVPELGDSFWCVGSGFRALLEEKGVREGVVMLVSNGTREGAWPALGAPTLVCDPMLESGGAWALYDPSQTRGGLQIRHAPADLVSAQNYARRYHPGAPAYVVVHDVARGALTLLRVPEAGETP